MYVIRMKNCAFFARHGVLDEEERLGQRFYIDAELEVSLHHGIEADSIEETVDYGLAFLEVEKVVRGKRRFLIEALALDVAKTLCQRFIQISARPHHSAQAKRASSRCTRPRRSHRRLAAIKLVIGDYSKARNFLQA